MEQCLRLLVEFTAPVNPDPTYAPYGQKRHHRPGRGRRGGGRGGGWEGRRRSEEGEEGEEGRRGRLRPGKPSPSRRRRAARRAAEGEGEEAEGESGPLLAEAKTSGRNEPWMLLARPTVSCFVRAEGKTCQPEHTLFLAVQTPVVAAPLALGDKGVRQDLGFDSVPVGQTRMRS